MTGAPPFYDRTGKHTNKQGIYNDIIRSEPNFDLLSSASSPAKDFIRMALKKDAKQRATIEQLLDSAWIKQDLPSDQIDNSRQLNLSANLVAFAKTTTFQASVCSILANLMTRSDDLTELRKMFVKWDTSQDGQLSMDELRDNMADITTHF